MKYWRVIILMIVMVTVVFLAGCRQDDPDQTADGGEGKSSEGQTLQLSDTIVELSVWQSREHGAEEIVSHREEELRRSIKLGIHEQEVVFRLTFPEDIQVDIAQLESIISFTGGSFRVEEGSAPHIYDVHLHDVRDDAELKLGDLPTFEFIRHENHLSFALNQSSLKSPYSLLIHSEQDGHSHIFISDQEEFVVIRFSAPMVRVDKPGTEWLSDTQLRINIEETDGTLDLSDVYSTEGNFLDRKHPSVHLHPTPSRSWFNAASGGTVGWSVRDAYYDALLFAQNTQRYAGLVKLREDEDGQGATYGIVIEQRSQTPIVMEHTIHVRAETGFFPVEWRNGGKLMYMSGFQLWEYDLNSGQSQKVVTSDDDVQHIAFQYDNKNQLLYILSQKRHMQNGQEYMEGLLDTYAYLDNGELVWNERQEAISDLWAADENGVLPLEIAMYGDGYYVTTYRGGSIVTYYTANGEATDPVPGSLIGVTERGAYLEVASGDGKSAALSWWPQDKEPVALTPFPEAASYIMFGGDLFANREGGSNVYYGYNMSADEWVEWSPNDGLDSWVPNQKTAYYRVED